ncbi:RagB/SusD family nutrient uptake outer membrane protein [Flaviaesturariibacter amylovorans]|uniref:RagB/SusD family nutrient uptake outer membrane protein n=1 Tax=Flaviaesturariibacter amylovorans TaxID=1084520 RepID=A0ABP8H0S8_9BACT
MRFRTYKKHAALLSVLFVLALGACKKDFLEVEPQGQTTAERFWQTSADADAAVNAIYGNLRSAGQVGIASVALESLGADDADPGARQSDLPEMYQFDNFSVTSSNQFVGSFWAGLYGEINLCNQVLDHVDTMSAVDATLKARYLAEAKFVRAWCYFRLVRSFGGVPLHLKVPRTPAEFNRERATASDVWLAIERDLDEAEPVLPATYGTPADRGRATKGAAQALHAKVALYQRKWSEVKLFAGRVIASGNYSLFGNYGTLFTIPNELNAESVFEIQAELVVGAENGASFPWSQYSECQTPENQNGWGWNVPSQDLVSAFTQAGDNTRMNATIIMVPESVGGDNIVQNGNNNSRYNQKSYVPSSYYVSGYPRGCQKNILAIRYADVLLMHAEALNELGEAAAAASALNQVRARAGLNPTTAAAQEPLRTAIWNERRLELAMENDRYFDVIRQGRAATVFGPKGWTANKNERWPIPYNEVLLSGGKLVQNPGYN